MSKELSFDIKSLPEQLSAIASKSRPYFPFLFLLFVILVYGYLFLQINSLQSLSPSQSGEVANKAKVTASATPHIDPKLVDQLVQLKNNSVSVQALFDQTRSNPFAQCSAADAAKGICQPQFIEVQ
ncbi:MAG TPA: hypothetical protein VFN56_02045 [Candidatus Saccharimonadales bacterium]|nr:hypothetical protein [Candidatus Saccharimonadales bacterium]